MAGPGQSPDPTRGRSTLTMQLAVAILSLTLAPLDALANETVSIVEPASQAAMCPNWDPLASARRTGGLPNVERRLASTASGSSVLRIVAFGSSSTAGYGASSPLKTYPAQLRVALSKRLPGVSVDVINAGKGGQTVHGMLQRLSDDVLRHEPDLVIWQVGSNALLKRLPLEVLEADLRQGIQRIRLGKTDLILMGMQHAPRITARQEHTRVRELMTDLSTQLRVPYFDRFALMQHWRNTLGEKSMQSWLHPDGLHMNDPSYHCLGEAVAEFILRSTRPPAGTASKK